MKLEEGYHIKTLKRLQKGRQSSMMIMRKVTLPSNIKFKK
jgi:hypothetical protein